MYKEALLKQKSASEQLGEIDPVAPTPTKLPSVEYFANFRAQSLETHSVTSTENTARSKGITPSESWADDDDEFMASLQTESMQKMAQKSQKEKGWKEVAATKPVTHAASGATKPKGQTTTVVASAQPFAGVGGGRFDALAPDHGKRWR